MCSLCKSSLIFGAEKAVVGDKTDQIFEKVLPSLLLLDPTTVMNEHRWLLESFGQIDAWSMKRFDFFFTNWAPEPLLNAVHHRCSFCAVHLIIGANQRCTIDWIRNLNDFMASGCQKISRLFRRLCCFWRNQ